MTVKLRIMLLIVGAGFISSILFSVVVFFELIEQPFELLDAVLKEEAYRTTKMLVNKEIASVSEILTPASWEMNGYWIEIYDKRIHKIVFRSGLAQVVKLPRVDPGVGAIVRPVAIDEDIRQNQRLSTFRIKTFALEMGRRSFIVRIARPMEKLNHEMWELGFGILAGLIFSTLALIVISRFVAGKILQPIAEIKDLAQEISEKNLTLRIPSGKGEDEFSELAGTINQMLDRLQYSFARQRDFLFDTSHELKTPLTTMRLAIDEICAQDKDNPPPHMRDNLLRLSHTVLRMERMAKDLLNLSALETLPAIDLRPVPISDLLASLIDEYRFIADARNITIRIQLPQPLVIQGDGEKLYRAFSNILDNAVKYNTTGGTIDLTAEPSSQMLTVTITNTGPGVAEKDIPKVFDQFYRVEKSRSLEYGGSGLGLAIVQRIVGLHDGRVRFESRQGAWTRVTVHLPRHQEKRRL